jgi:hypothetical protein
LALLVARVGADHLDAAVPTDDLALLAHGFDAGTYLHRISLLLVPIGNATSGEVVGSDLHLHSITWKDANPVHAHLPRRVSEDFVPVLETHLEHGVWEGFDDFALHDDRVFLGLRQVDLRTVTDNGNESGTSAGLRARARAAPRLRRRESIAQARKLGQWPGRAISNGRGGQSAVIVFWGDFARPASDHPRKRAPSAGRPLGRSAARSADG